MGIDQLAIDPRLRVGIQPLRRQFAGRKHYLLHPSIDHIAINVNVHKFIILPQRLDLIIGLQQRAVVPKTNIANGLWLGAQGVGGQLGGSIVTGNRNLIQGKGFARKLNIVGNKRAFQIQFIRADLETLHQAGVNVTGQNGDGKPNDNQDDNRPPSAAAIGRDHEQERRHGCHQTEQIIGR